MQHDPDDKSLEAHDIPEDIRAYVKQHHLRFDEYLWSPVVQKMIRLRIQMEENGAMPKRAYDPHDPNASIYWRHWQE
jgi:hypothetical protein